MILEVLLWTLFVVAVAKAVTLWEDYANIYDIPEAGRERSERDGNDSGGGGVP